MINLSSASNVEASQAIILEGNGINSVQDKKNADDRKWTKHALEMRRKLGMELQERPWTGCWHVQLQGFRPQANSAWNFLFNNLHTNWGVWMQQAGHRQEL